MRKYARGCVKVTALAKAGSSLRDGDNVKPIFAEVTDLGQP
jgi:hypothetical protein